MLYQNRDWECFNYNLWPLKGVGVLRGPDPRPLPSKYVSHIGTAHAFGRFVHVPYPQQLAEQFKLPGLDLSTSAVGPRYYLDRDEILSWVNASAVCVVQTPSARSAGNSLFHNRRWGNNVFQRVNTPEDSPYVHESEIFPTMFKDGRTAEAKALLAETCRTWTEEMVELLQKIRVPKILLWFSSRSPKYNRIESSYEKYCGDFPQLVDDEMMAAITPYADDYLVCEDNVGLPVKFYNRFMGGRGRCYFGTIWRSEHSYYPSQQMHDRCAEKLAPLISKYLPAESEPVLSPHAKMLKVYENRQSQGPDKLSLADVRFYAAIRDLLAPTSDARGIALHLDQSSEVSRRMSEEAAPARRSIQASMSSYLATDNDAGSAAPDVAVVVTSIDSLLGFEGPALATFAARHPTAVWLVDGLMNGGLRDCSQALKDTFANVGYSVAAVVDQTAVVVARAQLATAGRTLKDWLNRADPTFLHAQVDGDMGKFDFYQLRPVFVSPV